MKKIIFVVSILLSLSGPSLAEDDADKATAICADLGFRKGSDKFSDCALRLYQQFSTEKNKAQGKDVNQKSTSVKNQNNYTTQIELDRQRQISEEQAATTARQLEQLRAQQQLEQQRIQAELDLKKRQVDIEQRNQSLMMMQNGLQMLGGTGPYAPKKPNFGTTCYTWGNTITCN